MELSRTKYAKSGDVSVAYRVGGEGPDLVVIPGWVSHVELMTDHPIPAEFARRLMSFSRLIMFDKRGTGLSDPVDDVPTFEQRMDDIRAVLDAIGSERAWMFGLSEGAPLGCLFAATYPQRCEGLVLYGAIAKSTWAPDFDHPWVPRAEDVHIAEEEYIGPMLEAGDSWEIFAPSFIGNQSAIDWFDKLIRYGATPAMLTKLFEMYNGVDVRAALPAIQAPTLVMHRRGDRVINRRHGEWVADHIPGAQYLELPGNDHIPLAGNIDVVIEETRRFVTGDRGYTEPDRVLAAVAFTDIVDSTITAAKMGDSQWREVLDHHDALTRKHVEAARGRVIKHTGDGTLATFDGPGRAIRCMQGLLDDVKHLGIELRAGVHTGEVELRGDDVGGLTVHIASRISGLAGANEVIVSRTVKDLVVGSGIEFRECGKHTLKGVPGEWEAYSVATRA